MVDDFSAWLAGWGSECERSRASIAAIDYHLWSLTKMRDFLVRCLRDLPSEGERSHDTEGGGRKRRLADPHHQTDRGLQPDLEQEQRHAEGGEHVGHRVVGIEVSERRARDELAEHRQLPDTRGQVGRQLRRHEDQGRRRDHRRDRVEVRPWPPCSFGPRSTRKSPRGASA